MPLQRTAALFGLAFACSLAAGDPAAAQAASPQNRSAPAPSSGTQAPAAQAAPAPALDPQRTTATFGDWVLRCVRPERAAPACALAYIFMSDRATAVGQLAIGHLPGEPMRATLQVPVN